jgi:hypothetical protein
MASLALGKISVLFAAVYHRCACVGGLRTFQKFACRLLEDSRTAEAVVTEPARVGAGIADDHMVD